MEVFYEKNIYNENVDKHKKRTIVFKVLRYVSIVIAVVIVFLSQYLLINEGTSFWMMILSLALFILFAAVPFVLLFIFFGILINRQNLEFDYYIMGDIFRVVKVINRKKRKKFFEIRISAINSIGMVNSKNFDRYSADKNNKRIVAFCDDNVERLIFAHVSGETEKQLLILEFDDEFLVNLRKAVNSYSVFDDSVKQYLSKASKNTQSSVQNVQNGNSDTN